jgi:hypothetical protein
LPLENSSFFELSFALSIGCDSPTNSLFSVKFPANREYEARASKPGFSGQRAQILSIFDNISAYCEHQQIFRKTLFCSDIGSFLLLSFEARHPGELMRLFGGL